MRGKPSIIDEQASVIDTLSEENDDLRAENQDLRQSSSNHEANLEMVLDGMESDQSS